MSRFCGWTRRSQVTLCAWVVLLVVEACTSHAGLNHCAACEHMSSVGVGVKRHSMLHALLSRKLDFSSWSFLCFKAKYVLGWVLCLFA